MKKLLLFTLLLNLATQVLFAQNVTTNRVALNQTYNPQALPPPFTVEDAQFGEMNKTVNNNPAPTWANEMENLSAKGVVGLYVVLNPSSGNTHSAQYSAKVKVTVDYYTYSNGNAHCQNAPCFNQSTVEKELYVNFSNTGSYIDKDVFELISTSGVYKMVVTVDEVQMESPAGSGISFNLEVRGDIVVHRNWLFNPLAMPTFSNPPTRTENEVKIVWYPLERVSGYDLEWTYVSDYLPNGSNNQPQTPTDIDFNERFFQFNSTRVSLTASQTSFSIPLLYPSGYIVYRLRGVGEKLINGVTHRIEGAWQMYSNSNCYSTISCGTLSSFYFYTYSGDGFLRKYNWQMSADFSEKGKNAYSIAYFDGTLRKRQEQMRNNATGYNSVSETIYDYQGRPAINILPAPIKHTTVPNFEYIAALNKEEVSLARFSRMHFDKDLLQSSCLPEVKGLSATSGTSRYFSASNDLLRSNTNDFAIADARGFPFVQTTFMPDNTGRVREQGGVGEDHQVGSGHDTRYFYSKPEQKELNRMLGCEAGLAEHYKKNTVVDANGQISNSYLNLKGQVIATSLAGERPDNLSGLLSYPGSTSYSTLDLLSKVKPTDLSGSGNILDLKAGTLTSSRGFTVTQKAVHHFAYKMNGSRYEEQCGQVRVCDECVLDLSIRVKDLCGADYLTGIKAAAPTSTSVIVGESVLQQIINQTYSGCSETSPSFSKGFTQPPNTLFGWSSKLTSESNPTEMGVGSYTITKELKVNTTALEYYTNKYMEQSACLKSFDEFLSEEEAKIDFSGCDITCADCITRLGSAENYSPEVYSALVEKCNEPCKSLDACRVNFDLMLMDVSPGGQYGNTTEETSFYRGVMYGPFTYGTGEGEIDPTIFPMSVYNVANLLPRKEAIFNDFYTNYNQYLAALWSPSWKFPYNPEVPLSVDKKRFAYLDEKGNIAYIQIQLKDGVFYPEIDLRFASLIVTQTDGSMWIQPQYLIHLADFERLRQPSWIRSLVAYHPEYGYYEECKLRKPSNDFSVKITEEDKLADIAQHLNITAGQNGRYTIELQDHDPYFLSGSYNYSTPCAPEDVNCRNNEFISTKYAVNNSPTNYEKAAFNQFCASYLTIGSNTLNIQQYAYMLANCKTDRAFPSPQSCSPCATVNLPATLLTDEEWLMYRSLYFSLKQKFMQWRNDVLAVEYKYYNGCIGNSTFDVTKYGYYFKDQVQPYTRFYDTYPWNSYPGPTSPVFNNFESEFYNPEQPCNVATHHLYVNKTPRFAPASTNLGLAQLDDVVLYAPANPAIASPPHLLLPNPADAAEANQQIYDDVKKLAELKLKKECLQCPVASSLEALMNTLLVNDKLSSTTGITEPLHCTGTQPGYPEFNTVIESSLTTITPLPNDFSWHGHEVMVGNNKRLEVHFSSPTSGITPKGFYVEFTGADASRYGFNKTDIVSFCCLKRNTFSKDNDAIEIKVNIRTKSGDPLYVIDPNHIKQITLYGKNAAYTNSENEEISAITQLTNCVANPVCHTSKAARGFKNLLNGFIYVASKNSIDFRQITHANGISILDKPYGDLINNEFKTAMMKALTMGSASNDAACGHQKYLIGFSQTSSTNLTIEFKHETKCPSPSTNKTCSITLDDILPLPSGYSGISHSSTQIVDFLNIKNVNGTQFYITALVIFNGTPHYVKLLGNSGCINMGKCLTNQAYSAVEFPLDQALMPTDEYASGLYTPQVIKAIDSCYNNIGYLSTVKTFLNNRIQEFPYRDGGLTKNTYEEVDYQTEFPLTMAPNTSDCFIHVFNPDPSLQFSIADIRNFIAIKRDYSKTGYSYFPNPPFTPTANATPYIDETYSHGHFEADVLLKDGRVVKVYGYAPCVDTCSLDEVLPSPGGQGCGEMLYANNFEDTIYTKEGVITKRVNDFHFTTDFPSCASCVLTCTSPPCTISNTLSSIPVDESCVSSITFTGVGSTLVTLNALVYRINSAGSSNKLLWRYDHLATASNTGVQPVTGIRSYRDYKFSFVSVKLPGCSSSEQVVYTLKINGNTYPLIPEVLSADATEYSAAFNFDFAQEADIQLLVQKGNVNADCLFAITSLSMEYMCEQRLCCPVPVVQAPATNPCEEQLMKLAYFNAKNRYEEYIRDEREAFKERYIKKCLTVYEEFFMQTLNLSAEHHFTLYYYDQAGNLVRTVPPEGVNLLDESLSQKIDEDRAKGVRTVFTNHTYTTTYKYNSLNQLVSQTTPDQEDMDIKATDYFNNGIPAAFAPADLQFMSAQKGLVVGAEGANGKLFSTDNGGENWTEINALGIRDIYFSEFTDATTVFACGKQGTLLKSTTKGIDWQMMPIATGADLMAVHFYSGTEGVVLDKEGKIWVSHNSGDSWSGPSTKLSNMLDGKITSVHFSDGMNGYAVTDKGKIYTTADGGLFWLASSAVRSAELNALHFDNSGFGLLAGKDGTLLKGTLQAANDWTDLNIATQDEIKEVHVKNTTTWCVLTGTDNINYTTNSGVSFTTPLSGIKAMYFDNATVGFAVSSTYQLYKTIDGGANWLPLSVSYPVAPTGIPTAICFNETTNEGLVAGTNGEVFMFDPANGTMSQLTPPGLSSSAVIRQVHFYENTVTPLKYYFILDNLNQLYLYDATINNWAPLPVNTDFVHLNFKNTTTTLGVAVRIIGASRDVFKAEIGIATPFALIANVVSGMDNATKAFATFTTAGDVANAVVVGNDAAGALIYAYSNAAASTFVNNSSSITLQPLYAVHGNATLNTALVAGAGGRTYQQRNVNSFNYWVSTPSGTKSTLNAVVADGPADSWWTAGNNGVILNKNSAATSWTNQSNGSYQQHIYALAAAGNSGAVYATGAEVLLEHTAGTWAPPSSPAFDMSWKVMRTIAVSSNADFVMAGNNGKIANKVSTSSWALANTLSPAPIKAIHMLNDQAGYFVCNDGKVYSTLNAGQFWQLEHTFTGLDAYDVWFTDIDKGYVCGQLSGSIGKIYELKKDNGIWLESTIQQVTGPITSVHFNGATGAFSAPGASAIYYITNDGTGWSSVSSGGVQYNRVFVLDETAVMLAGHTAIGKLNLTLTTPAIAGMGSGTLGSNTALDVWFKDYTTGYALTANTLFKTTNGGNSWSTVVNSSAHTFNHLSVPDENNLFFDIPSGTEEVAHLLDYTDQFSSRFYYDKLGRLVVSQNSKQYAESHTTYSYTLYDFKGRITEVGKITAPQPIENSYLNGQMDDDLFTAWVKNPTAQRREVTCTWYDAKKFDNIPIAQENLRNRVVGTTYEAVYDRVDETFDQGTHYTYDIHGNVNFLLQENNLIADEEHRFKSVAYEYDLISGVVHSVSYQKGKSDQFLHRYTYDETNRLTEVETSSDNINWHKDVKYFYYLHGPLARVELGNDKVQGLDYAYTIHGWIKSVNSNTLVNLNRDPGKDGLSGPNADFAKDEFGYMLHYFANDYQPVVTPGNHFIASYTSNNVNSDLLTQNKDLYNGNISHMVTAIRSFMVAGKGPQATSYQYDQLNRLKEMTVYNGMDIINNVWNATAVASNDAYHENYTYDANGNILTLNRKDHDGAAMDNFTYHYQKTGGVFTGSQQVKKNTNRLLSVHDAVTNSTTASDVKSGQATGSSDPDDYNYSYDQMGNLIKDVQEEIQSIEWNTYGKIYKINRTPSSSKSDLEFAYDASGNRTMKKEIHKNNGPVVTTWYVRDAQGNVLSTYEQRTVGNWTQLQQQSAVIYGSSRVGEYAPELHAQSCGGTVKVAGGDVDEMAEVSQQTKDFINHTLAVQDWTQGATPISMSSNWETEWDNLPTLSGTAYADMDKRTLQHLMNGWMQWMCSLRCYKKLDNTAWTYLVNEWHTYYVLPIKNQMTYGFAGYDKTFLDNLSQSWQERHAGFITLLEQNNYSNGCHIDYAMGSRQFELSNHLGNVLVTVSDRKIVVDEQYTWVGNTAVGRSHRYEKGTYVSDANNGDYEFILASDDGITSEFLADVRSAQDYYPFGMIMPGRPATPAPSCSGTQNVNITQQPVVNGQTQTWQTYNGGSATYNSSTYEQEITMPANGTGAEFLIPNVAVGDDHDVTFTVSATAPANSSVEIQMLNAGGDPVGIKRTINPGQSISNHTFTFTDNTSPSYTMRITGVAAANYPLTTNWQTASNWQSIATGGLAQAGADVEVTVNNNDDGAALPLTTPTDGNTILIDVDVDPGDKEVTARVYDQAGNPVSAPVTLLAVNSGTQTAQLTVPNCTQAYHEVRLTGLTTLQLLTQNLVTNGQQQQSNWLDIATATHTFGVSNLDVTVNATGDGVEYSLSSMPVNGNTIDVKVDVTTGSNNVEIGLYDLSGTPLQTPQIINGGNIAGQALFTLSSTQSNYRVRATGNTVAGLLPQNIVTNGHLQTWNSYNSGIPFTNTTTQDITANNPAEGASYTFTTPAPGIQVYGTISVLAGNNDAVVEFFDQLGTSVYGPVTVPATTTANINFNFTSNISQHEVRVTSDPLGSTYPDVMYVTAFDATALVPGQVPDNFSITNVHVLESLYVAAPDKFYVKNVTANATAYPAKAYVSHLSATQQFTVSRPVCSNVEDFLLMTRGYRFGFNGQEKEQEIAEGIYTAEYWEYDSRIGRRWNTDPVVKEWESPYACFRNNPIYYADPSGLDGEGPNGECPGDIRKNKDGTTEKYTLNGWEKADEAKNYHAPESLIQSIKDKEGLGPNVKVVNGVKKAFPYLDPVGIPTVGYGYVLKSIDDPSYVNGITIDEADQLLRDEVKNEYEKRVVNQVTVPITQNEFNQLLSSVYNGGAGSSVWNVVNTKNYDVDAVFTAFLRRRSAKGKELPGLISRRALEAWGYLYGSEPNLRNVTVRVQVCTAKGVKIKALSINTSHMWINAWNNYADQKAPIKVIQFINYKK